MPELSRFYGIIIRMFVEVGGQHHRPHFHAYHQDAVAVFGIDPVELISGDLPTRQRRLVEAWAELHQAELAADWACSRQASRRGPSSRYAEESVMSHPIHRVASFELLEAYRLRVRFEDGAERTIDLEPVLFGALYGPLRDPAVFGQVRIDPEVRTLVWPNGADFDPATLHDWPDYAEAFASKAREWRESAA